MVKDLPKKSGSLYLFGIGQILNKKFQEKYKTYSQCYKAYLKNKECCVIKAIA
jgi:hypothetical protein